MNTLLKNKSSINIEALDLYKNNQGLIYKVYEKMKKSIHVPFTEAIQEGNYNLWKACLTFDKSKNIKFSTYAYTVIKNGYLHLIKKQLKYNETYSIDNPIPGLDNDITYKDNLIDYSKEDIIDQIRNQELLNKFNRDYGEKFLKYLKLKYLGGYKVKEITQILNIERKDIVKYKRIIKKIKIKGGYYEH